jgi:hypothetical protein
MIRIAGLNVNLVGAKEGFCRSPTVIRPQDEANSGRCCRDLTVLSSQVKRMQLLCLLRRSTSMYVWVSMCFYRSRTHVQLSRFGNIRRIIIHCPVSLLVEPFLLWLPGVC